MSVKSPEMKSGKLPFPAMPYKGLGFYGPEDMPLFAGRDEDVEDCADVLAHRSTRAVMLHGVTGCGKTSFLRAGLIPYLENESLGFQFLKGTKDQNFKTLFIRSTENPLARLAELVHESFSSDLDINTPRGRKTLKLAPIFEQYSSLTNFIQIASNDPKIMLATLSAVATVWPRTLVLVIDQAEELLTLNPTAEGDSYREKFFEFVWLFGRSKFDLKLMFSLRTEYYGRFIAKSQRSLRYFEGVDHYFLNDLDQVQLVEAITRPTSTEEVPGYGKPYDHYRFSFETGLPERISAELKSSGAAGGTLTLMQIVCDNLYRRAKSDGGSGLITASDYSALGGIEGQLEKSLDTALRVFCMRAGFSPRQTELEINKWKDVLSILVKYQLDGTVTTDLIEQHVLIERARSLGCELEPAQLLQHLSDEKVRILRLANTFNIKTREPVTYYSLGHDAMGLALKKWAPESTHIQTLQLRRQLKSSAPGLMLVLLSAILNQTLPPGDRWSSLEFALLLAGGVLLAVTVFEKAFSLLISFPYSVISSTYRKLWGLVQVVSSRWPAAKNKSTIVDPFVEGSTRYYAKSTIFWLYLSLMAGVFGVFQTQWFVAVLNRPDYSSIRDHMNRDKNLQEEIGREYQNRTQPPPVREQVEGFEINDALFTNSQIAIITNALRILTSDQSLQRDLEKSLGHSFLEIKVEIIPSWELDESTNDMLGVTREGWQLALAQTGKSDVRGFTLRDRQGSPRVTIDGRPRIALNPTAFGSEETLRLTLVHELFHAMNVPGVAPSRFTFAQDDLTYLPEYRSFLQRSGLEGNRQYLIWLLAVIMPWTVSLFSILRLLNLRKAKRESDKMLSDYLSS